MAGIQTCVTCLGDDFVDDDGILCNASNVRHFVCQTCLDHFVHSECDAENVHRYQRRGRIFCPNCPVGGNSDAVHLQCDSGPYSHSDLAANLPESTFNLYIGVFTQMTSEAAVENTLGKIIGPQACSASDMLEMIKATLRSPDLKSFRVSAHLLLCTAISTVESSFSSAIRAFHSKTVEEFRLSLALKRHMPQARQCGACGFGPVDIYGCADLQAHHGQAVGPHGRIQNTCPNCGWFAPSSNDWPRWDGVVSGGSIMTQLMEFYFIPAKNQLLKRTSSSAVFWITVLASLALLRYCGVRISGFAHRPSFALILNDIQRITSVLSTVLHTIWSVAKFIFFKLPNAANFLWVVLSFALRYLFIAAKIVSIILTHILAGVLCGAKIVFSRVLQFASITIPPVLGALNRIEITAEGLYKYFPFTSFLCIYYFSHIIFR